MKLISKKSICPLILLFCLLFLSLGVSTVFAATGASAVKAGLNTTASKAGLVTAKTDLPTMVGTAINYLFGVIGVIFLTIILIGGYLWMTAGGNEEKVTKAKGFIMNGVNGMIVIFLAYALIYTMLYALKMATGG